MKRLNFKSGILHNKEFYFRASGGVLDSDSYQGIFTGNDASSSCTADGEMADRPDGFRHTAGM